MSAKPPERRPLADVLDELVLQEDLEDFQAMDPAKLDEELARAGYDDARMKARIEATRAKVEAVPSQAAAPPPKATQGGGKVIDFTAAKARRSPAMRLLLVAAAAALLIGGSSVTYVALQTPTPTTTAPTQRPGPPPEALASVMKDKGLRQCAMGYFGECRDTLDEAAKLSPETEKDPRVVQARADIEAAFAAHPPGGSGQLNSKPKLGPGERPLKPKP